MHRNGQYQSPVVQSCTEISGTRGDRIVESTQADTHKYQFFARHNVSFLVNVQHFTRKRTASHLPPLLR